MSHAKPCTAIALVFLIGLSMWWLSPASAQVIHENPANLTSQQPFDINGKLMLQLEQMFGSLDSVAYGINVSDFDASRLSMDDYDRYYSFFKDYLNRTSLTGSDYQRFVSQADLTADELRRMINNSEAFNDGMSRFERHYAEGDTLNATLTAVELQKYYNSMNGTNGNLTASAAVIGRMLQNTSVNTNNLDAGIDKLNVFMQRVDEINRLPLQLLGDTNLTLNASRDVAGTGDIVAFAGRLESDGTAVAGGLITLSIDNVPVAETATAEDGSYVIFFMIPGSMFDATLNAIAVYDPQGASYTPAVSNNVELRRLPVNTYLTFSIAPEMVSFGDIAHASGRLTAEGGYPVPGHLVAVVINDQPACYANTTADGYYACDINITPRTPAGLTDAFSRYDASLAPGEALADGMSPPVRILVLQETTALTLDPFPSTLYGGQIVSFAGSLTDEYGQPVRFEEVAIYADDMRLGYNDTDETGRYNISLTVPCDLSSGYHMVYAGYRPGDGMSLAGSSSEKFNTWFPAARPNISISGMPLIAFQGDTLNLTVCSTACGQPINETMLTVSFSGFTVGQGMTDANGSLQMAFPVAGMAGLQTLSVSSEASGLLEATTVGPLVLVMPFDLPGSVAAVIVLLLIAGLAFAVLTRADRRMAGMIGGKKKPLPKPTRVVTPLPDQPKEWTGPSPVTRFEDEIARINTIISESADRRMVIAEIYTASRRMARDHGIALPDSATHREFFKALTAQEPSLLTPAGTITKYYEAAVFGHVSLSERDITNSLHSLREIKEWTTGARTGGSP